jgi:hypothetical protein
MDTITLVNEQIEEGQMLLDRLSGEAIPVRGACWVKPVEVDRWSLYLTTPLVDEQGATAAYREVYRVLRSLPDARITDSDVTLIGTKHAVAKDLLGVLRRYSDRLPRLLKEGTFGGMSVEEVYVYPPPKPAPRRADYDAGTRRLKRDVEQIPRSKDLTARMTPEEQELIDALVAGGMERERAEYAVRQQREVGRDKLTIPTGTVVRARIARRWGGSRENDPNPLLLVEAPDGGQGLTMMSNTDPA